MTNGDRIRNNIVREKYPVTDFGFLYQDFQEVK